MTAHWCGWKAWRIDRFLSKDVDRSEGEIQTSCKRTGAKTKLDLTRLPSADQELLPRGVSERDLNFSNPEEGQVC